MIRQEEIERNQQSHACLSTRHTNVYPLFQHVSPQSSSWEKKLSSPSHKGHQRVFFLSFRFHDLSLSCWSVTNRLSGDRGREGLAVILCICDVLHVCPCSHCLQKRDACLGHENRVEWRHIPIHCFTRFCLLACLSDRQWILPERTRYQREDDTCRLSEQGDKKKNSIYSSCVTSQNACLIDHTPSIPPIRLFCLFDYRI